MNSKIEFELNAALMSEVRLLARNLCVSTSGHPTNEDIQAECRSSQIWKSKVINMKLDDLLQLVRNELPVQKQ